jgi:predicted adenine nucleotide alpha hydrolase (AANH) superfamily ATPase
MSNGDVSKIKGRILMLACCAPCCCAVAEKFALDGVDATLFFHNPNIYPAAEYEKRKAEAERVAKFYKMPFTASAYVPEEFKAAASGLEGCLERGERCAACFLLRMKRTARYAKAHGFDCFTSTLAFSRWKSQEQVAKAGGTAAEIHGVPYVHIDWRKGGALPARAREIIKERGIYEQEYCGCEYSVRGKRSARRT